MAARIGAGGGGEREQSRDTGNKSTALGYLIVLVVIFVLFAGAQPFTYAANASFVNATTLQGQLLRKPSGVGIAGASINLVDADNIVMDVTTTDKNGTYTLDLDVLADDELMGIPHFFLEITDKGKKIRQKLSTGLTLKTNVLWFKDIWLP